MKNNTQNQGLKDIVKARLKVRGYNRTVMAEAFAKAIESTQSLPSPTDYYGKVIPELKGAMVVLDSKLYKELIPAGIKSRGCIRVSGEYFCHKTEEFIEYFMDACKKSNIIVGSWEIKKDFYYPRYEKVADKD